MSSFKEDILILCKTYPSPSGRHIETSCVAGVNQNGNLIRLFPVPFRLIDGSIQFKKWQWINARIEKAPRDHRTESHKIYVDTIQSLGQPLPTTNLWQARRKVIDKLPIFKTFSDLEIARASDGVTLGLLSPSRMLGLDITPCSNPDWTPEERAKLLQSQQQGGLFDSSDEKAITTLRKLPFDFHYRYECEGNAGIETHRHKIADWEAGALYWNCRKQDSAHWEELFRRQLESKIPECDLMFLMGTIHRFPDQWLIVSLIYPPKRQPAPPQMTFDL